MPWGCLHLHCESVGTLCDLDLLPIHVSTSPPFSTSLFQLPTDQDCTWSPLALVVWTQELPGAVPTDGR